MSNRFGLSLTIDPVQREVTGFGTISQDGISIGPSGLRLHDEPVSKTFESLDELEDKGLLGTGVSGSVRKVFHAKTNKCYALKTMQIENSEEYLEKKLIELKTLMTSDHPGIVDFEGAFYNDGALSFILEFCDKGTIADLLDKVGKIPFDILAKLTYDLLGGLNYLHKKLHLIHRDIKPQNILLNSEGAIKITDFGVSGEIAHTAAFAKTFVGTVKYMSPARIKGQKHSSKSDIWSFGLVTFECALGSYPYPDTAHTTFFSRLNDIVSQPVPSPPTDTFPPEVTDFISKCLKKDEDAMATAEELLEHEWVLAQKDLDVKGWLLENC